MIDRDSANKKPEQNTPFRTHSSTCSNTRSNTSGNSVFVSAEEVSLSFKTHLGDCTKAWLLSPVSPWIYWLPKFKPGVIPLCAGTATAPWGSMKTAQNWFHVSPTLSQQGIPCKNGTCPLAGGDTPNPSAGAHGVQYQQFSSAWKTVSVNLTETWWEVNLGRGWCPLKGFSRGENWDVRQNWGSVMWSNAPEWELAFLKCPAVNNTVSMLRTSVCPEKCLDWSVLGSVT